MIQINVPLRLAALAAAFLQEIDKAEKQYLVECNAKFAADFAKDTAAAPITQPVTPPPPPQEERMQYGDPISLKAPPIVPICTDVPPPPPNDAYERLENLTVDTTDGVVADPNGLDAESLPWDARIHSSSKAFLAKTGCWKLARNIDKNLAASVRAELIAKRDAKTDTPPPPPAAAPAPVTPPPPPATTAPTGPAPQWNFGEFCQNVVKAGKTFDQVSACCQKYGLKDQTQLAVNPALIMVVAHDLGLVK